MSLRRTASRTAAALGLAAVAVLMPLAAHAAAGGTTQLDGQLVPDSNGACTASPAAAAAYVVSGSLVGCWYVDTFNVDHTNRAGGFVASGTETFDGCAGSRCGHFFTTYTFTAKFSGDVEDHGRCHHPITGGDGGFSGVTGSIDMKDLPNGCADYHGHISN